MRKGIFIPDITVEMFKNASLEAVEELLVSGTMEDIEIPDRQHGEWIPCSESLPEECENVLAWIERDAWVDGSDYPKRRQESAIGWHIDGRWHFDGYAGRTTVCLAWMPLPEPYKKEGGENGMG